MRSTSGRGTTAEVTLRKGCCYGPAMWRSILPVLLLGQLLIPLLVSASAAQESAAQEDSRLERLVTLDSYFPFTPQTSPEAWAERRAEVRRQVLVAAGLWPEPPRCPMDPVVHGAIEREGYTVERVFLRALPGLYVSGNLYRPSAAGDGPHPGVLCPHGHWAQGRFTVASDADAIAAIESGQERHLANAKYVLQARCAHLARMGCVVFHYDMLGYADSKQLDHRSGFGDLQAELWGMSWFGLQTLSSIRALDFLESLPDVDPERIGVTGASGGGTQTFILGAVDDRPDVLFPAVMVSTAMQGGCVCENASHLRVGTGNIELAAMAAPRPLWLTGANDWTIEIESKGLPELRELYATLGVPDRVGGKCYPSFPHNYNRVSRQHMYGWFDEHLGLGVDDPTNEGPIVPIEPARLSVFDEAHPRPKDAADLEGVRRALASHARSERQRFAELATRDPDAYRRVVGGALSVLIHGLEPSTGSRPEEEVVGDGGLVLVFPLEGITELPLDQMDGLAATPTRFVKSALGPVPTDANRHSTYVGYTWGYNPTLFAHRVRDVLASIIHAGRDGDRVALIGLGDAAPWVVCAAALAGDAVDRVVIQGGWDFDRIESLDDPQMLPGALRWGGLPAFAALIAPTPMLWVGEEQAPAIVRAAYAAAGEPGALEAVGAGEPAAIARWLEEGKR